MKEAFTLLFSLIILSVISQNHNILFDTKKLDRAIDIRLLNQNNILISRTNFQENYMDIYDENQNNIYGQQQLIIYNINTKKADYLLNYNLSGEEFLSFYHLASVSEDSIIVLATYTNINLLDSIRAEVKIFNNQLELIHTVDLKNQSITRPRISPYSYLNNSKSLIIPYSSSDLNSNQWYLVEYDIDDGIQKNILTLPLAFRPRNIFNVNDELYVYSNNTVNNILKINNNFGIDSSFAISEISNNQYTNFVRNNTMYFNNRTSSNNKESIIAFNNQNSVDTLFSRDISINANFNVAPQNGIDIYGRNLYFSNNLHVNFPPCYVEGTNEHCANYFSLHRVDTSGQHYWSNYYGGDYAYLVNNVVATPDSGCLVVFAFNRGLPTDFTHSIRYLKVDKHGNPELNYLKDLSNLVGLEEVVADELPMLKLYPNPASNVLNVEHNIKGIQHLEVYNMQGQLLLQQSSTGFEQSLIIDKLPIGQYILRLLGKEKVFSYCFVKGE